MASTHLLRAALLVPLLASAWEHRPLSELIGREWGRTELDLFSGIGCDDGAPAWTTRSDEAVYTEALARLGAPDALAAAFAAARAAGAPPGAAEVRDAAGHVDATTTPATAADVEAALGAGRSLILRFERWFDVGDAAGWARAVGDGDAAAAAAALVASARRRFGAAATVHLYASGAGGRALPAHSDIGDVVAMQLDGEKRWTLCAPALSDADAAAVLGLDAGARLTPAARAEVAALLSEGRGACGSFDRVDAEGRACETSVLRVGDALYVPKGVVHAAANAEGAASVHLAVGFAQRVPARDALRRRLAATNGSTWAPTATARPSPLPTPAPSSLPTASSAPTRHPTPAPSPLPTDTFAPTGLRSRDEVSCSEDGESKVCTSSCDHFSRRCEKPQESCGSCGEDTCCSTPPCKPTECTALADDMPPGSWAYCAQDWQNPDYDRDDEYPLRRP